MKSSLLRYFFVFALISNFSNSLKAQLLTELRDSNRGNAKILTTTSNRGEEYILMGSDDLVTWEPIQKKMAFGQGVNFALFPEPLSLDPGQQNTPVQIHVSRVTGNESGLFLSWRSLDEEGVNRQHFLRGAELPRSFPSLYNQTHGLFDYTIFTGQDMLTAPRTASLSGIDQTMATSFTISLTEIVEAAQTSPEATPLDPIPPVTSGSPKRFWQIERRTADSLDWDGDGVSNINEFNLFLTNPFASDTDYDGVSDFVETSSSNSRNPRVNELLSQETELASARKVRYSFDEFVPANPGVSLAFIRNEESSNFSTGPTILSNPTLVDNAIFQKSILIRSLGERLIVDRTDLLSPHSQYTISFWFRLQNGVSAARGFFGHITPSSLFSLEILNISGSLTWRIHTGSGLLNELVSVNQAINANTWYHIAVVRDSEYTVYLNGQESFTTLSNAPNLANGNFILGARNLSGNPLNSNLLNGELDEFQVFTRALTDSEIESLAQPPSADLDGDGRDYNTEISEGTNPLVFDPPSN